VRKLATYRLENQGLLAEIAGQHEDAEVARVAVSRLETHALLAGVAESTRDSTVRQAALDRVEELHLLAEVVAGAGLADTGSYSDVRKYAVFLLKDQELLAAIASYDRDSYARCAAVRRLEDQQLLAALADKDRDLDVRQAAIERLDDPELLARLAKRSREWRICEAALARLEAIGVSTRAIRRSIRPRESVPRDLLVLLGYAAAVGLAALIKLLLIGLDDGGGGWFFFIIVSAVFGAAVGGLAPRSRIAAWLTIVAVTLLLLATSFVHLDTTIMFLIVLMVGAHAAVQPRGRSGPAGKIFKLVTVCLMLLGISIFMSREVSHFKSIYSIRSLDCTSVTGVELVADDRHLELQDPDVVAAFCSALQQSYPYYPDHESIEDRHPSTCLISTDSGETLSFRIALGNKVRGDTVWVAIPSDWQDYELAYFNSELYQVLAAADAPPSRPSP
jgi:hypothetical protein